MAKNKAASPVVGDIVILNRHTVHGHQQIPMMVTHVDDILPDVVSGVAFSAHPDVNGFPAPAAKIVDCHKGKGNNEWMGKPKVVDLADAKRK